MFITEFRRRLLQASILSVWYQHPDNFSMELPLGLEPRTYRLQGCCATNCATEAYNRKGQFYFTFVFFIYRIQMTKPHTQKWQFKKTAKKKSILSRSGTSRESRTHKQLILNQSALPICVEKHIQKLTHRHPPNKLITLIRTRRLLTWLMLSKNNISGLGVSFSSTHLIAAPSEHHTLWEYYSSMS